MKIKKILTCTIMASSILCCLSSFATDKTNNSCITNFLNLKPSDNRSFLIANNYSVSPCTYCGNQDHTSNNCPNKSVSDYDSDDSENGYCENFYDSSSDED